MKKIFVVLALFGAFFVSQLSAENIAPSNGIVTVSSTYADGVKENAIDGDAATTWNAGHHGTATTPAWLIVDVQNTFTVSEITLQSPDTNGHFIDYTNVYQLSVSADGENWTVVGSGTLYDSTDPEKYADTIAIPEEVSVLRYVKYAVVGGTHWAHLGEMEIESDGVPAGETATITVSLAKSFTETGGALEPQIYGDVKLTYGHGGTRSEYLCTEESSGQDGICEVEIPIGDLVVIEKLNESLGFGVEIKCSIDGILIPHLDAFYAEQDTTLSCDTLADKVVARFLFPGHSNEDRGDIKTKVTYGSHEHICNTGGHPKSCAFVLEPGDYVRFSKILGNASYSTPGRPKNLEENVDLQITEDTEIFVSNGEVAVTVHGFASSVSGEMVCGDDGQARRIATFLPGITVDQLLTTDEWYQFAGGVHAMRDGLRKKGFQVVEFNYDWRRDLYDTAHTLIPFLENMHEKFGKKSHLATHSMGGLLARILIQGGNGENVQSTGFVGTPHTGSVDAVYLRGGNFKSWTDRKPDAAFKEGFLDIMRWGCNFNGKDHEYVRQEIPSSAYLLPTVPYFAYTVKKAKNGTPVPLDAMCDRNFGLEELNADADSLLSSGIPMKIFASTNKRTILRVSNRKDPLIFTGCTTDWKWLDRKPKSRHRPKKTGDGTVSFDSAYPADSIKAFAQIPLAVFKGSHGELPGDQDVIDALAEFFWKNATQ